MAITDKTRKVLWGRSGNRCAICRQPLVVERTLADDHSVVGDECHIHSGASNGPRNTQELDSSKIDEIDNLLLLCRVHHKMVDDQFETYTADLLRSIKRNHEQWVNDRFKEPEHKEQIRVVRFKSEIPTHLKSVVSGHELFNGVSGCHGHYPYHSDDLSDEEIELVGGFIQSVKDWGDLSADLEPIEKLRAGKALSEEIQELRQSGFRVFGAREKQQLRGGINPPSNFYVYHIAVVRERDAAVVPMPVNQHSPDTVPN
jgi:hypothetical protein